MKWYKMFLHNRTNGDLIESNIPAAEARENEIHHHSDGEASFVYAGYHWLYVEVDDEGLV